MRTPSLFSFEADDPLGAALKSWRAGETDSVREVRLKRDVDAKRKSNEIDAVLREEAEAFKKQKRSDVNLLLLGPRESGKSTLQKQFQILYAPDTLDSERFAWREVIYANVAKNVSTILNLISEDTSFQVISSTLASSGSVTREESSSVLPSTSVLLQSSDMRSLPLQPAPDSIPIAGPSSACVWTLEADPLASSTPSEADFASMKTIPARFAVVPVPASDSSEDESERLHRVVSLQRRLAPFQQLRDVPVDDPAAFRPAPLSVQGKHEIFVRSGWQKVLGIAHGRSRRASMRTERKNWLRDKTEEGKENVQLEKVQDLAEKGDEYPGALSTRKEVLIMDTLTRSESPSESLEGSERPASAGSGRLGALLQIFRADIVALWAHPAVQKFLETKRVNLALGSGFYLDDLDRVAAPDYVPTDVDILGARVQTVGVTESRYVVPNGPIKDYRHWRIFDVSGAKGQRMKSWSPYFQDAHAVIFMISLSCFDEYLEENPKKNRLKDSFDIWQKICQVQELRHQHLIVFLNKKDLLKRKLDAGVQISDWITSFGGRNDCQSFIEYCRRHVQNKFTQAEAELRRTPNWDGKRPKYDRQLFIHETTAIDTQQTKRVIADVREIIARKILRDSQVA